MDFDQNTEQKLEQTEKLVYAPAQLKKQVQAWQKVLKTKPYGRDVLLQLAALNYQLYKNDDAQDYWQQAFYLDPNNLHVQTIGKIIGVIK